MKTLLVPLFLAAGAPSVDALIHMFIVLAIVALSFICSLALYFVCGVLIVNPFLCFFGLLACGLFWIVVKVDEHVNGRG